MVWEAAVLLGVLAGGWALSRGGARIERVLTGLKVYIPPEGNALKTGELVLESELNSEFVRHHRNYVDLCIVAWLGGGVAVFAVSCVVLRVQMGLFLLLDTSLALCCVVGLYMHMYYDGLGHPDNNLALKFLLLYFMGVAGLLWVDHSVFVDFDFHWSSRVLGLQLLSSLQTWLFLPLKGEYVAFAGVYAGYIVFLVVPVFAYAYRSSLAHLRCSGDQEKVQLRRIFFAPLVLIWLWATPVSSFFLLFFPYKGYQVLKVSLVLTLLLLRILLLRTEVAVHLEQTLTYIEQGHRKPANLELFTAICKELISHAPDVLHRSLCYTGLLFSTASLLLHKGLLSFTAELELVNESGWIAPVFYRDSLEFALFNLLLASSLGTLTALYTSQHHSKSKTE